MTSSSLNPPALHTMSLSRRRSSGQALEPLHIPPCDDTQPIPSVGQLARPSTRALSEISTPESEEVIEEGEDLFTNFLYHEIQKDQVDLQEDLSELKGYKHSSWAKTGRDLRIMGDEFARTRAKEREQIRQHALQRSIDVEEDEFKNFLREIFVGGLVTKERILMLFFFCCDIARQALRVGKQRFMQFVNWSLRFIFEHVCAWVQQNGGWGQILKRPFDSAKKILLWSTIGLAVFGVLRGIKYLKQG